MLSFPYRAPTVPDSVDPPRRPSKIGSNFETEWARSPAARWARALVVEGPMRLMVRVAASPERNGLDRLEDLRSSGASTPVIFAANHHSHLDTPLLITSIPEPWRHRLVVGAAADYFFTSRITGTLSALTLNAFPVDRTVVSRKSTDLAGGLLTDGWSLLIYPEGGRSPDGWSQPFHRGTAYLARKADVPVVPIHLEGTGQIFGKGMTQPRPGRTLVTFGAPLWIGAEESTGRFNDRIEAAVQELADEASSDWWTARRNAARGQTPSLSGPQAGGWRRAWRLTEDRRRGKTSRVAPTRQWPKL